MQFAELVRTSADVAEVSGRRDKIERLAALLRRLEPEEIDIGVAYLTGSLRQGRIGLGWATMTSAQATPAETPTLSLREVDKAFERLSAISGPGSVNERAALLRELLARATREEQEFLFRLVMGELRQGALEGVLLEAVARAASIAPAVVRRAAMLAGDLAAVARVALHEGEAGLSRFVIAPFRPVLPMLAEPADSVDEAIATVGRLSLEWKLDGARIQVHKSGDEVRVYSRTLRDVTAAVPEVVAAARRLAPRDLIVDGEVIALRPDRTPQPFQVTMQRFGRRLDVDRLQRTLPLEPFFFDLLYAEGAPLLDEPQARRFEALKEMAGDRLVPALVDPTPESGAAFVAETLARGHEGVMAKALDAPYMAGARGRSWLKIKAPRTLDLVVLAAEWGHGRRQGWLSNLHLGARDPERNAFVMLGKTFKGLTDEMLAWQTQRLLDLEIGRDRYTVYVRPELVVEIAFADVQRSPVYPGGLALRFARVKRYRTDKTASEADTFEAVQRIYRQLSGEDPPPRR